MEPIKFDDGAELGGKMTCSDPDDDTE